MNVDHLYLRTFTDEIVEEAAHPAADVFYTENSPPLDFWPNFCLRRESFPGSGTRARCSPAALRSTSVLP